MTMKYGLSCSGPRPRRFGPMAKPPVLYYRWLMRSAILVVAVLAASCSKAKPPDEHGEPGERVYVSDEDGGHVVVLPVASTASGDRVIARIAVGKRPRGLRVSPDGSRLFVALSGMPKAGPGVDESKLPPADPSADGIGRSEEH